jgi:hypothetical protein
MEGFAPHNIFLLNLKNRKKELNSQINYHKLKQTKIYKIKKIGGLRPPIFFILSYINQNNIKGYAPNSIKSKSTASPQYFSPLLLSYKTIS